MDIFNFQQAKFFAGQAVTEEHGQHRAVSLAFERLIIGNIEQCA